MEMGMGKAKENEENRRTDALHVGHAASKRRKRASERGPMARAKEIKAIRRRAGHVERKERMANRPGVHGEALLAGKKKETATVVACGHSRANKAGEHAGQVGNQWEQA